MSLNLEDYINKPRDSVRERKLAKALREQDEKERLVFIQGYIQHDPEIGLRLANSCLRNKASFHQLLLQGLVSADASSINRWLKYIIPKLGFCKVIKILTEEIVNKPGGVKNALYWLPSYIGNENTKENRELENLKRSLYGNSRI